MRRGLPVPTIDEEWILARIEANGWKCPYTGLELKPSSVPRHGQKPSLDRIDNEKGYTPDNVEVTSWFWNRARGTDTVEEALALWAKCCVKKLPRAPEGESTIARIRRERAAAQKAGTYYLTMSNRFENPDEAHAWSTFFAAQCPRVSAVPAKNIQKEIDSAAACADEMLHAWRERAYAHERTDDYGPSVGGAAQDEEPTEVGST